MAAAAAERLPVLEFRTAFRNYEPAIRGATLIASLVIPASLLATVVWLLPGRDLLDDRLLWVLLISAVVAPVVFLSSYGVRHTLRLAPDVIEYRELRRRRPLPTRDVGFIMTIRHPKRVIFAILSREGAALTFGPGLAAADQESTKAWLRSLAASLPVEFREDVPFPEAVAILSRSAR